MARLEHKILQIRKESDDLQHTILQAVLLVQKKAAAKQMDLQITGTVDAKVAHDPNWLSEAVYNLLDNSVKYAPEGSDIRIRLSQDELYTRICVEDGSDKSELLQLFLRKDTFEDTKFPELSKAVMYFKEMEGGFGEMCKTVEDFAKDYAEEREKIGREEERINAIRKMLKSGLSKELILSMDYSETELEAAEQELLTRA